jgi:hypothetical protein
MLLDNLTECEIYTSLQNNLFDHKAVSVTFNSNRVKKEKINYKISNSDLNDDLLRILVHATIAETYLLSATDNIIAGQQKQVLLNTCGTVKNLIRECGPPINSILGMDPDPVLIDNRERKKTRLQVLLFSLNLQVFEQLVLDCDPMIFLETLLLNLRNEVVSYQIFTRKARDEKKMVNIQHY